MKTCHPFTGTNDVRNSSCFSAENLAKLQEIMYRLHVPEGSTLYMEGEPADKLYFIYQGKMKVSKYSDDGKEYILYLYQDGDFFGQIDPYSDSKHSFSAQAVEDCQIGAMQKSDLEVLLWQHGDLAIEFMKWMGLSHRLTQTKLRDLLMHGKSGALSSTLIRLSNSYGIPKEDGIFINMKINNSELADYIGCARESVNRMLGDLRKAGAISINCGHITITNLEHLKNICKCEQCPSEICRI